MGNQSEAEQVGLEEEDRGNVSAGRKRDRSLIEFPYSDLGRAYDLTKVLGASGGKVWIEQTQLAVALDMASTGGTFRGRLSAAKMFGFIETDGGKVRLSDLGLHLLDETTERTAKVEGFLRVPLYKAMFDSYNGFALPPAAAIERQMLQMGVPPKQVERARQAFASSAQTAEYIAHNGRFSKPTVTPVPARDRDGDGEPRGGNGGGSGNNLPPPPTYLPPSPPAEKLEYRLVDLMSEAANDPEVMKAILTVITFLKTGNGPKKTATDQ